MPHWNYTAPKHHWKAPVGDGLLTKLDAVPGEVLQQSGFGLMLFGIFLNFLDDGKGNVQIQSEDDPQLERACGSLERGSAFQITSTNWASGVKRTICG